MVGGTTARRGYGDTGGAGVDETRGGRYGEELGRRTEKRTEDERGDEVVLMGVNN